MSIKRQTFWRVRKRRLDVTEFIFDVLGFPLIYLVLPPYFIGHILSHSTVDFALWMGATSLCLLICWGSIMNHYADWQADEINHKRVWLHEGGSRSRLLRYQFVPLTLFLLVSILSSWHQPALIFMFLLGLFSALQYSIWMRFKDRLWFNYVYLAFAYGVYPLFLGLLVSGINWAETDLEFILWILSFLLLVDIGIAPVKDFEDIPGDVLINKKTLPANIGFQNTHSYQTLIILTAILVIIGMALATGIFVFWILTVPCLGLILLFRFANHGFIGYPSLRNYSVLTSIIIRLSLLSAFSQSYS